MIHRYYGTHAFFRATPGTNLTEFARRATLTAQDVIRSSGTGIPFASIEATTGPIIYTRGPGVQEQQNVIATRLGAVALIVLVIAAANVANLLLARATRRRREIAVRLALGVGRWRLARMLTAETLLLALIAAGAALAAAWWGGAALRQLLLPDVTFVGPIVDLRVLWFTLAAAVLSGLIAGLVPAIQSTNPDLTRALKEGARDGGLSHSRLRSALVVIQAALSVVLLVGASLFVRSLQNVRGLDLGFDVDQVVIGTVGFDEGQSPPLPVRSAAMAAIELRMTGKPGILSTSRSNQPPMAGASYRDFWFGNESSKSIDKLQPTLYAADDRYFVTTGIRLVAGRLFEDRAGAPPEVMVNQDMASVLWPGREPLGQCMRFESATSTCYSVVGVVESSRAMAVVESARPQYFLPRSNMPPGFDDRYRQPAVLLVRTTPELATRVIADVAAELRREFPTGYPDARLMSSTLAGDYRPWRVGALLFSAFGVLALVVAVLGIYSTVSYTVSQRTHEFGIRIALGARIADLLRLVLGEGLRTVALGVVAGIALALAAGRLVASLLYGIQPSDPRVLIAVSVTLLVVAGLAALVPAWRASRVDPTSTLRAD
jgi:predicted permease